MEASLQTINGTTESIEENNRIKALIKNYFPERDCFVMMENSNASSDEKNDNVNKIKTKKIFQKNDEEIKKLKNKIIKKMKPKMFYNNYLTGDMLIELIESLLNSINSGGLPILYNSWKYIMKSQCSKVLKNLVAKFGN